MPVSESNRVVVEIDKDLKTRLYAALALESCTLKDWFKESVEAFLISKNALHGGDGRRHQKHKRSK